MTDNEGVEKSERNLEENNNVMRIDGITETETSDFLEEISGVREINQEIISDLESDSDVINSFIQNTSGEVGYLFKYLLRHIL